MWQREHEANIQPVSHGDRHESGRAPGNGLVYIYSPTKTPIRKIQFCVPTHRPQVRVGKFQLSHNPGSWSQCPCFIINLMQHPAIVRSVVFARDAAAAARAAAPAA